MIDPSRIPVIAAIGEIIDRPATLEQALEPVALMAEALLRADEEAGGQLIRQIDSLDVVNQISWPYAAPAELLCRRTGIAPARISYGKVGGETPLKFIQEAARRIRSGASGVTAIVGGEAHHSVAQARKTGLALPWTAPSEHPAPSVRGQDRASAAARGAGIDIPVTVYPLFENAQAERWGQTPVQAAQETAVLWSAMSRVATTNPYAAIRRDYSPEEIATIDGGNRMIAAPYSKLMVANIAVNQGAAIILTSLAVARAAGLDDGRLLFVRYGNAAREPGDVLDRADLAANLARETVLRHAGAQAPNGFDAVDLYSCFPCVPKAARRLLELDACAAVTVTGGLTFFGAPLNNYMTHATCAMARHLRARTGNGLLYGQGGFATKHRTVIVATAPDESAAQSALDLDLQEETDLRRAPPPTLDQERTGAAVVETSTVIFDRSGSRHGAVIARRDDGTRCIARVPADDDASLSLLDRRDRFPIGHRGAVRIGADTALQWSA